MAIASGVGRADILFLHLPLSSAQFSQMLQESMKSKNAFGRKLIMKFKNHLLPLSLGATFFILGQRYRFQCAITLSSC